MPHVQPGSRTQVKEKEESIAHFGPFAAESVQKVFNQKNSRYVVSELDRRDILEDVSILCKVLVLCQYALLLILRSLNCLSLISVQIPENLALEGLAGAMIEAWRIYNRPK